MTWAEGRAMRDATRAEIAAVRSAVTKVISDSSKG